MKLDICVWSLNDFWVCVVVFLIVVCWVIVIVYCDEWCVVKLIRVINCFYDVNKWLFRKFWGYWEVIIVFMIYLFLIEILYEDLIVYELFFLKNVNFDIILCVELMSFERNLNRFVCFR